MYQKPLYFSNEEYNVLVQEGVREFVAFKEDLCTSNVSPYVLAPILDYQMYLQAMETLSAGVAALNSMGLTHTAEALGYSRVYNYDLIGTDYEMEPLVYDNDEWANALYWDSGLEFRCFDRFEQEALVNGKTSGAFSGTYVYEIPDDLLTADRTLLDMAMQLHQVNYMVTYAARGEDIDMSGYYIHVYIWDVYDFVNEPDLGETYGQLVVNLANNNCATYQEAGYIHEFEIHAIVDF